MTNQPPVDLKKIKYPKSFEEAAKLGEAFDNASDENNEPDNQELESLKPVRRAKVSVKHRQNTNMCTGFDKDYNVIICNWNPNTHACGTNCRRIKATDLI